MSAWRRKALQLFPERAESIRARGSIHNVLSSLDLDLRATYGQLRPDREFVDRVFAFAASCFDDRQNWDLRNAVAVGFYEHLANCAPGRRDIASHLSFKALEELQPLFYQMLEPPDYEALLAEIERVHRRRPQLPSAPAI